jgi:hypothetical protein
MTDLDTARRQFAAYTSRMQEWTARERTALDGR